jgi:thiosulfate/3-mercaptopyruvate sulfurtransferase
MSPTADDRMDWRTLVDAETLAARIGDAHLRLVDARFVLAGGDPAAGERAWRESRLPGAGFADLDRDLSDRRKPASEGRHPLPDAAAFRATLARLGITPGMQVVPYPPGAAAWAATRVWWLLRLLGHVRVAVLDGGFARWTALGLPLERGEPPSMPAAAGDAYPAAFVAAQVADAGEVQRVLTAGGRLLDARARERFRGDVEPLDLRAGHIPGARNRPFLDNLRDGRFLPAAELRADFLDVLGGVAPRDTLLNCGSGVTACQNLLAMEHAGLHGARVYAGSWSGWISDPLRPVALGD